MAFATGMEHWDLTEPGAGWLLFPEDEGATTFLRNHPRSGLQVRLAQARIDCGDEQQTAQNCGPVSERSTSNHRKA